MRCPRCQDSPYEGCIVVEVPAERPYYAVGDGPWFTAQIVPCPLCGGYGEINCCEGDRAEEEKDDGERL